MDQRLSLITLGVRDLQRARRFYASLGWRAHPAPEEDVVFFQAGGMVVALWDRAKLALGLGGVRRWRWGGVTLAYNTRSPQEVDTVIAEAHSSGATIIGREAPPFALARPPLPRGDGARQARLPTANVTTPDCVGRFRSS